MAQFSQLLLDGSYSRSFLSAAAKAGLVCLAEQHLPSDRQPRDISWFLDEKNTRKLRQDTLETAVLFDHINLTGLPDAVDLSRLRNTGLIGLEFNACSSLEGSDVISPQAVLWAKSCLMHRLVRRHNTAAKEGFLVPITFKSASAAFDALAIYAQEKAGGLRLDEFRLAFVNMAEGHPTIEVDTYRRNALLEYVVNTSKTSPDVSLVTMLVLIVELTDFWFANVLAENYRLPILSSSPSKQLGEQVKLPTNELEAFRVCRVAFKDELKYAPRINDFEDVLRLRDDKNLARFKKVLKEWCDVLPEGHERTLRRVRNDIALANRELKRLKHWKRADALLFYTSLPLNFVPILSHVAQVSTVAAFTVGSWIKRNEKKHGWVMLGR